MEIGSLFTSIDISAGGLKAQRRRLDVVSQNIANAETTRTPEGGPYQRKMVVLKEANEKVKSAVLNSEDKLELSLTHQKHMPIPEFFDLKNEAIRKGVEIDEVVNDEKTPFRTVYDPSHPDADQNGYVEMPNVNIINEMVDMMTATRAYEANATAMNAAKQMALKALEI
ncbi:MAG: flagellar basal body rod protein FlgC [Candidatus Delongbacteria bacterium]|nr:flagellar basal body rod protein FlgC [Candidatus Delongbacteria bacterium]